MPMPSSKKQRGRQRKAAASVARACSTTEFSLEHSEPRDVVEAIRHGNVFAAKFAHLLDPVANRIEEVKIDENAASDFRKGLMGNGLIQVALKALNPCDLSENPYRSTTKLDAKEYILLLATATQTGFLSSKKDLDKFRLEIARTCYPIVRCILCNTSFYKGWYSAVPQFCHLVSNIAVCRDALEVLVQYKGLVEFMIQALFWELHRPDIAAEYAAIGLNHKFKRIRDSIINFIHRVFKAHDKEESEYTKQCIRMIGLTPIVMNGRRGCSLFIHELIADANSRLSHLCEPKNETSPAYLTLYEDSSNPQRSNLSLITLVGLTNVECVDKDVISGVIDLARLAREYEDIYYVLQTFCEMIWSQNNVLYSDYLLAYAIDQGIIEVAIDILVRIHSGFYHNSNDDILNDKLLRFSKVSSAVSMFRRSSKAIVRKRDKLMKILQDGEIALSGCCQTSQEILRWIEKTVLVKVAIKSLPATEVCCYCCKTIMASEAKSCSNCLQVSYCSQDCQKEAWDESHKLECKDMSQIGDKSIQRRLVLRRHLNAAVDALVEDNKVNLLAQAAIQGYELLDSVTDIQLSFSPVIKVRLPSMPSDRDDNTGGKRFLVCSCCAYPYYSHGTTETVSFTKHFDFDTESWVSARAKWEAAQAKEDGQLVDKIHHDEEVRKGLGPFFVAWYHDVYLKECLVTQ